MASLVRSCCSLSGCSPPRDESDRINFSATGGFYVQASDGSVTLPAAGYDYDIDWTPMSAGLAPAGMAASFAALARMSVAICGEKAKTTLAGANFDLPHKQGEVYSGGIAITRRRG